MAADRRVVVGLGSNRWHGRFGRPERVLAAAVAVLASGGLAVERVARVKVTAPLGPSWRAYANGAVLGRWSGSPDDLLALCQRIERDFGRRRGRRWGARVLDLDLWLAEGEVLRSRRLTLPHPRLPERDFVLGPLAELWPEWRSPVTRLTVRQMRARLLKPKPCPTGHCAWARSSVGRATDF